MPKYLVIRCSSCNKPVDAVRVGQLQSTQLGEAVCRAALAEQTVELDEEVGLGQCRCQPKSQQPENVTTPVSGKVAKPAFRWTIRQLLFVTAIAGVLSMVFRNPIVILLGIKNFALAFLPWYFYRWVFLGIEMPAIKKGPPAGVEIFLLCANLVLAVLAGFYVLRFSYLAIRYGWRKVSQ